MHRADVSEEGLGWSDVWISEAVETSLSTVLRTRRQLVEDGLEATLSRQKRSSPPPRIFDGEAEPKLIALACSEPPQGHACWSLRMLEKRVVELWIVEAASDTTIQRELKEKNALKPHQSRYWVILPKANAAFVAAMEDVLEVYTRPHDPACPLVCLDETSPSFRQMSA